MGGFDINYGSGSKNPVKIAPNFNVGLMRHQNAQLILSVSVSPFGPYGFLHGFFKKSLTWTSKSPSPSLCPLAALGARIALCSILGMSRAGV
jgi:hypothetical protein